jgi:succinate dehydrogenase / fumarate reductase cytochrome b subunit
LSGVFPIAVFMLAELVVHAKAVSGAEAHRDTLEALGRVPARGLWQLLVLVPLLFHAGYGVVLALRPDYNLRRYPLSRNWTYLLQRATGVAALLFIAMHAVIVWLPVARGELGPAEIAGALSRALSTTRWQVPWLAFAYLLGIGACALHLGCGLWTFATRWGIAVSPRARGRAAIVSAVVGILLFALGARTVLYFATGWRIGGSAAPLEPTLCPVPAPTTSSEAKP